MTHHFGNWCAKRAHQNIFQSNPCLWMWSNLVPSYSHSLPLTSSYHPPTLPVRREALSPSPLTSASLQAPNMMFEMYMTAHGHWCYRLWFLSSCLCVTYFQELWVIHYFDITLCSVWRSNLLLHIQSFAKFDKVWQGKLAVAKEDCQLFQMWPQGVFGQYIIFANTPHDVWNESDCHWCVYHDNLNLVPVWHACTLQGLRSAILTFFCVQFLRSKTVILPIKTLYK